MLGVSVWPHFSRVFTVEEVPYDYANCPVYNRPLRGLLREYVADSQSFYFT